MSCSFIILSPFHWSICKCIYKKWNYNILSPRLGSICPACPLAPLHYFPLHHHYFQWCKGKATAINPTWFQSIFPQWLLLYYQSQASVTDFLMEYLNWSFCSVLVLDVDVIKQTEQTPYYHRPFGGFICAKKSQLQLGSNMKYVICSVLTSRLSLFSHWMKSDFLHFDWPFLLFSSDRLITSLPFITAQTPPMVTHPIWRTISSCRTHRTPPQIHSTRSIKRTNTGVRLHTSSKHTKGRARAPGGREEVARCTQTSARSQRQMVSQSGLLVPPPLCLLPYRLPSTCILAHMAVGILSVCTVVHLKKQPKTKPMQSSLFNFEFISNQWSTPKNREENIRQREIKDKMEWRVLHELSSAPVYLSGKCHTLSWHSPQSDSAVSDGTGVLWCSDAGTQSRKCPFISPERFISTAVWPSWASRRMSEVDLRLQRYPARHLKRVRLPWNRSLDSI